MSTRAIAGGVTLVVAACLAIGFALVSPNMADLAAVRGLPRFHGRLHGPPDRRTPRGERVAAVWWAVDSSDEDSSETYCTARARDRLVLDTGTRRMPITFSDAPPEIVGLVSDDRTSEHGLRYMIDLGDRERVLTETIPPNTCAGDHARYGERTIADGAEVDVVGCEHDGAIAGCDGTVAGVIAVDGVAAYLAHAKPVAERGFRFALAGALFAILLAGLATIRIVMRSMRVLRPVQP